MNKNWNNYTIDLGNPKTAIQVLFFQIYVLVSLVYSNSRNTSLWDHPFQPGHHIERAEKEPGKQ